MPVRIRIGAAVVALALLTLSGVGGQLIGRLSEVQQNDSSRFLPKSAESTRVSELATGFAVGEDSLPYFVVIERSAGLRPEDRARVTSYLASLPGLPIAPGSAQTLDGYLAQTPGQAVPSKDGQAELVGVTIKADRLRETIGAKTVLYLAAEALREAARSQLAPHGLAVYVTGPGGVFADFVTAFGGIDSILLYVALGVVFFILLLVYRSPVLPFTVLLSAGFGLSLAALVVFPLAKNGTLDLDGQSQGILSILVVGASTDYALLLVARFREELHDEPNTWLAMTRAWRASLPPIAASAATVILGLLCLRLSDLGNTRGLGPVGAIGIAGAFVASLTFLPAVLVTVGRRIFWPRVPAMDHVHAADALGRRGLWGRVASLVGAHPRRVWVLTLAGLLALAAFVPTLKADGVSQSDIFLTRVESVTGQEVLAAHFPAGSGSPAVILAPEGKADAVVQVLTATEGLGDVRVGELPGVPPKVVDGRVQVQATLVARADSAEAEDLVAELRTTLDSVGTDVLVGGSTATSLDVRTSSERDLRVIAPAILAVIFLVLALLLRSLVASVILVAANVVSFAATVGAAAIAFNHVFKFPGSDPSTPLYAFVFLVALGIDYSIFLMTRVREETHVRGTRGGILVGLAVTGGVITSAGIVLASTFAALAVLPILFLVQIAFLVAFGVLLDTLVVRSLLVPALGHDIGSRIWWPSALTAKE
ncbi:MAG TPA: MMPL family transporter [Candidatus Lustribacter sp.]|nr:MMPL family transporter [Candidatus Lustribacter sp.]